jgi:hypothetical protein
MIRILTDANIPITKYQLQNIEVLKKKPIESYLRYVFFIEA